MQTKIVIKPSQEMCWHEISVSLFDVNGNPVADIKSETVTANGKAIFDGSKHYSHFDNQLDLSVDGRWTPFYGFVNEFVIEVQHPDNVYPLVCANAWSQK